MKNIRKGREGVSEQVIYRMSSESGDDKKLMYKQCSDRLTFLSWTQAETSGQWTQATLHTVSRHLRVGKCNVTPDLIQARVQELIWMGTTILEILLKHVD